MRLTRDGSTTRRAVHGRHAEMRGGDAACRHFGTKSVRGGRHRPLRLAGNPSCRGAACHPQATDRQHDQDHRQQVQGQSSQYQPAHGSPRALVPLDARLACGHRPDSPCSIRKSYPEETLASGCPRVAFLQRNSLRLTNERRRPFTDSTSWFPRRHLVFGFFSRNLTCFRRTMAIQRRWSAGGLPDWLSAIDSSVDLAGLPRQDRSLAQATPSGRCPNRASGGESPPHSSNSFSHQRSRS